MPRASGDGSIARNNANIAAAIAEVNAELGRRPGGAQRAGRPRGPTGRCRVRPRRRVEAKATVGSASTFAVASVAPPRPQDRDEPIAVASSSAGTTGGNDWGVQLGAYRAKGDAERQLLTTALKDVPQLNGGLRRVEAAKVQGVTVYRAQFVGLSQADALGACETLARAAGGLPAAGAGDLNQLHRTRAAAATSAALLAARAPPGRS